MQNFTIYHNPRCSKSRQTLQLLLDHNLTPTVIEYLKNPPTVTQLKRILDLLNLPASQLMRTKEGQYQALNLGHTALKEGKLIQIMCQHPILIERPIVWSDTKAAIGRPPENILEIL